MRKQSSLRPGSTVMEGRQGFNSIPAFHRPENHVPACMRKLGGCNHSRKLVVNRVIPVLLRAGGSRLRHLWI